MIPQSLEQQLFDTYPGTPGTIKFTYYNNANNGRFYELHFFYRNHYLSVMVTMDTVKTPEYFLIAVDKSLGKLKRIQEREYRENCDSIKGLLGIEE